MFATPNMLRKCSDWRVVKVLGYLSNPQGEVEISQWFARWFRRMVSQLDTRPTVYFPNPVNQLPAEAEWP